MTIYVSQLRLGYRQLGRGLAFMPPALGLSLPDNQSLYCNGEKECTTECKSQRRLDEMGPWGLNFISTHHLAHLDTPTYLPTTSSTSKTERIDSLKAAISTVLTREIETGISVTISEASKTVPIFPFATWGGEQASFYFR